MNICVYGASSNTIDINFVEKVERLGEEIAKRGHNVVYGGGAQGLMGAFRSPRAVKSFSATMMLPKFPPKSAASALFSRTMRFIRICP